MTRVAIYESGTNSTRLLVADVEGTDVKTIDRHVTVTRLGQNVDHDQLLNIDAMNRTVEVLERYRKIADGFSPDHSVFVATSAARDAKNVDEYAHLSEPATGCRLRTLSGELEGQYAFAGATNTLSGDDRVLLLDIGGGSTELVTGEIGEKPDHAISLDYGSVRVTEKYLPSDPPKAEELSQVLGMIRDELEFISREHVEFNQAKRLVGVASTITTTAAVELGLAQYDSSRINGLELTHEAVEDVFRTLATESYNDRIKNPGLSESRADVIVGGLLVFVAVLRHFNFASCLVSESDLLDGIALSVASGELR